MNLLLVYLPFFISFTIGYLAINLFSSKEHKIPPSIHLFLAAGLGIGISSSIVFSSFILFNQFNRLFIISGNLIVLCLLTIIQILKWNKDKSPIFPPNTFSQKALYPFLFLIIISLPLWIHAHFYAYGGWDAWSVWNLKAKFLFLSGDDWKRMFTSILWRSSPHYPLFLPCTILWGWTFINQPDVEASIFTSFLFTFLTIGLLSFALRHKTKSIFSFLTALVILSMPFYIKLSLSQYCDIVVSFYLLASFFCLIELKETHHPIYALLAGTFLAFLSFTKGEALIAALIILCLAVPYIFWKDSAKDKWKILKTFFIAGAIASIPSIIFYGFYAPKNITMINGLVSTIKPVSLFRLEYILSFYLAEIVSPNWNGLWLVLVAGLLLSDQRWIILKLCIILFSFGPIILPGLNGLWMSLPHGYNVILLLLIAILIGTNKHLLNPRIIIFPLFFIAYTAVITFYYFINTYFPIDWWLQVTLHRILYAALPTVVFWVIYALWMDKTSG